MTSLPEYAIQAGAEALHDASFVKDAGDGHPAIRVLADNEAAEVVLRAAAIEIECPFGFWGDHTACDYCKRSGSLWILRSTPTPGGDEG